MEQNDIHLRNINSKMKNDDFESYFLSYDYFATHNGDCGVYSKTCYSDNIVSVVSGLKLYKNDGLEVCVEAIDCIAIGNKEYFLYFVDHNKWNSNVVGENSAKNKFINGKLKLHFDKYDYLFALSSRSCECDTQRNVKGFEFEVSLV